MKRVLMLFCFPVLAAAFSSGPPAGLTGAPDEGTCLQCHGGNPLNSGDGILEIRAPALYRPDSTYEITIRLADPGQSRWGFEFTALDQGTISLNDAVNTQSTQSGGRTYVLQTSQGTYPGVSGDTVSWTFLWTAPREAQWEIDFYAAGNAADGNGGTSGDFIYAVSRSLQPDTEGAPERSRGILPVSPRLRGFPNPFNPGTHLEFTLQRNAEVTLQIFDLRGRMVDRLLADRTLAPGRHDIAWRAGDHLAAGRYWARLQTSRGSSVTPLLLVR